MLHECYCGWRYQIHIEYMLPGFTVSTEIDFQVLFSGTNSVLHLKLKWPPLCCAAWDNLPLTATDL